MEAVGQPVVEWGVAGVLRAHQPAPGPDIIVFLCGPPVMGEALEGTLQGLGYAEETVALL
jgi:Na+-transporting NADH:ubiquinone oxidoreductase subunit NqrF